MILQKIFMVFFSVVLPIMAQNSHMFLKQQKYIIEQREMCCRSSHTVGKETGVVYNNHDDYRLPTALSPISYFIRLLPFVNGDLHVRGYEEIVFEALEATSNITLHMVDITYYEDTFLLQSSDGLVTIEFTNHTYDPEFDFYVGYLAEPLEAGRNYTLSLDFDGIITNAVSGFYHSTYINENEDTVSLASTDFQPNFARHAFPCFDEPSFKATFQIEIGHEDYMGALTNMPIISSREINGLPGWTYDLFAVSPVMSSYLNAFAISDFVNISATSDNGVLFRVWTHERRINEGDYGLNAGHRMLTFYENYFEIPYTLPKQDMIAIPDYFFGAMENWGLIVFRESRLLVHPVLTSLSEKRSVAQIIGHEIAHMWLGNLVTLEWWSDTWLNEGFVSYYQYLGTNEIEPTFDIMEHFVYDTLQFIFKEDSLETSLAIRREVPSHSEITNLFDAITYSKGAVLVRMMENFLTHDTFLQGIKNYLNENAYSNVVQEILFVTLNTQAQDDGTLDPSMNVTDIMETWTLQPGYPIITVQINGDGTALLSQERYLQTQNENATQYTYWVPITYAAQDNPDFTDTFPVIWMSPDDNELDISGLDPASSWHIFNLQQSSFYRVNYDATTWSGISDQLLADYSIVDIRNRAQLLDDSFHLALSGRIQYDIPLSVASYLRNEDNYVPWEAGFSNIVYVVSMFSRTVAYTQLRDFLRSLINPVYDTVGSVDNPLDLGRTVFLRREIVPWACDFLYQPCLDSAISQYSEWMSSPDDYSIISPNLKSSVYCTAVSEGSELEWDFALGRYQTTESSEEVAYLLFAMACSKDIPTLTTYLDMAFVEDGIIKEDDAFAVFANVASTDVGRDIAWDYLVNNYIQLAAFFESFVTVQNMAAEVAQEFNTNKDLFELQEFHNLLLEVSNENTDVIEAAIETVEDNIAWMDDNYNDIVSWLSNSGFSKRVNLYV